MLYMHTVFHLQDELVQVLSRTKILSAMQMLLSMCEPARVDRLTSGHGDNDGTGKGNRKRRTVNGYRYYPEETLSQSQREEREDTEASCKTN